MTRDEARFALQGPLGEHFGHKVPEGVDDAWLNCWEALGMLKLDEPKSLESRAMDALNNLLALDGSDCRQVFLALENAGLKIVEK